MAYPIRFRNRDRDLLHEPSGALMGSRAESKSITGTAMTGDSRVVRHRPPVGKPATPYLHRVLFV
ncbi:MAG: hypothetical protein CVV30_12165 [Methanomicrobiales archaeon HGW-Methanomicrobiales-1]|nr:MAG: hypothetical protein CVV30_12165 [Methanomicrobiales archaeon HGW-Methanomicrobiales-1]